jgi:hypothetical protein
VAVSNHQGGYPGQQPPYGGQAPQQPPYPQPYGQQQYGGYPPPPPPSRKAGPIVVAIVGALMLIGAGVFVVTRFTGGTDDAAGGSAKPVAPSAKPTASEAPTEEPSTGGSPSAGESPSASGSPSAPAAPCNGCIPGATVASLVTAFKSKGYVCKLDRRWECNKGTLDVYISPH